MVEFISYGAMRRQHKRILRMPGYVFLGNFTSRDVREESFDHIILWTMNYVEKEGRYCFNDAGHLKYGSRMLRIPYFTAWCAVHYIDGVLFGHPVRFRWFPEPLEHMLTGSASADDARKQVVLDGNWHGVLSEDAWATLRIFEAPLRRAMCAAA